MSRMKSISDYASLTRQISFLWHEMSYDLCIKLHAISQVTLGARPKMYIVTSWWRDAPPTIACQIGQCKTNSPLFKFPSSLLGRDYSPSASAALQILKDRLQHVSYPSTTKRPRAGGVSYMLYQWSRLKVEKVFSNKVHYHPAGLLDQWAEIKPGRHLSLSLHHHHHSMSPVSNMQVQWYLVNGWTRIHTYIHTYFSIVDCLINVSINIKWTKFEKLCGVLVNENLNYC